MAPGLCSLAANNISKNVFFAGDLPDATDVAGIIRISAVNQERII